MTPLLNTTSNAELAYNVAHKRTRNTVERAFGVWKRRFPCLHRGLTNKLSNITPIIIACAVLHNIALFNNEPTTFDDEEEAADDDADSDDDANAGPQDVPSGNQFRRNFILRHFN